MPDPKTCNICGETKPATEFHRSKSYSCGYRSQCKACVAAYTKEHRKEGRAKIIYQNSKRRYWRSDRYRAHAREAYRQDPSRRKCYDAVLDAVRSGALVRQPCEQCGNPVSQAHHDDYGKSLEVRWLCALHHAETHRRAS